MSRGEEKSKSRFANMKLKLQKCHWLVVQKILILLFTPPMFR